MKKITKYVLLACLIICFNFSHSQTWHTYYGDTLIFGECPPYCPRVENIYVDKDTLFVSGIFINAGNLYTGLVTKWHNYKWFNLGIINSQNWISCLTKYKGNLFVGGDNIGWNVNGSASIPSLRKGLAYWDGSEWHATVQNEPPNGTIYSLIVHNDTLFATGQFNKIDGVEGVKIMAYYDGNWIYVGDVNVWRGVSMEVFNGQLLVGAHYHGIRRRTGATTWESFPGMSSGSVDEMVVDTFNNFLYIGGPFHYVEDTMYARNVAMYDGFKWHSLDGGTGGGGVINGAMAIYRGDLYIGGWFTQMANGLNASRIAWWDGSQWHDLQGGTNYSVQSLGVLQDTLFVGGTFYEVGDPPQRAVGLAKWFMPKIGCNYIKPIIYSYEQAWTPQDTFYLNNGQAEVRFYNNNAYVDYWEWDFGDGTTAYVKDPVHIYNYPGTYNVQLTITHEACVKNIEKTVTVLLGTEIEELIKEIDFKMYPNPANDNVIIECMIPTGIENANLKAHCINGRELQHIHLNSGHNRLEISVSYWNTSLAIISLHMNNQAVINEKLIINH